jgi:hypothetical protein
MNKTDTEPKTNWKQIQTGGDWIHLTFTRRCPRQQCKVLEAGQVQATGQNEDEAMGGKNEDETTTGGEN